jgi:hypothetical protein
LSWFELIRVCSPPKGTTVVLVARWEKRADYMYVPGDALFEVIKKDIK